MISGKLLAQLVLQSGAWIVLMGVLLFWPAGNWLWPQGWAFLGIFILGSIFFCVWLWRRDPALLISRLQPVVRQGQARWDKVFMACAVLVWNLWLVLMALDAQRWHTSNIPLWLNGVGGALIAAGFCATVPVFAANSFAAPVVRIQEERGHRLIDTGPYAIVRHPMYASALFYIIGAPLLLGSWIGLAVVPLMLIGMAPRAVREENLLRQELPGYADYMNRVRWRLIPHVW
jgi:protein-S-isoprenylcysteine O-methyltransferase Ste14